LSATTHLLGIFLEESLLLFYYFTVRFVLSTLHFFKMFKKDGQILA
jgi:hypothetical protein